MEYIETVETTADGGEIHIAHSGGELEGSTVILDPVLQVRVEYIVRVKSWEIKSSRKYSLF